MERLAQHPARVALYTSNILVVASGWGIRAPVNACDSKTYEINATGEAPIGTGLYGCEIHQNEQD